MPINDTTGELNTGLHKRMIEALNLVARSARVRASWSKKIRGAIKVGEVKEQDGEVFGYIEVGGTAFNEHGQPVNIAKMARAFEYGSGERARRKGPHGIGKYIITPTNAPNLAFMGTNESAGHLVKTPIVHHPGVAPHPFLAPAVQENRAEIKQMMGEEFHQYVSKAIRVSWSGNR